MEDIRQRIRENLRRHELTLTLDISGQCVYGTQPSYSGSPLRQRLIALGVRQKHWIKRIPLLNGLATRVYCFLVRAPASPDSSLGLRTKAFIRKIPVVGFLAWWAYSAAKAPFRLVELSNTVTWLGGQVRDSDTRVRQELSDLGVGLREEVKGLGVQVTREQSIRIGALSDEMAQLREEVRDSGVRVTKEIDAAYHRVVGKTLEAADSHTGPRAVAGLWFNEPIKVQYDEAGRPSWVGATERIIERAWLLRHLAGLPHGARILDVGCSESTLSIELASNGFQVTGIDIRPYPLQHPDFRFVRADICNSQLKSASYEVVLALSTIEHLGLGWYGDPHNESSDYAAMEQIHRLLKTGGQLLMTVPFGQRAQTPVHRIYDGESLRSLLQKFEIRKIDYGMKVDDTTWISPVAEERAAQQRHDPASGAPCAVCLIRCTKL